MSNPEMTIDQGVDKLIGIEGHYVNDLKDSGGETIWGITVATARRYGYLGPMRSMPRSEAVRIYKTRYITEPGFHKVWELSPKIGYELFDTGVNIGPGAPARWFQEHLNLLNRNGADYPDIREDGDVGPATIAAFKAYLKVRGKKGESVLLRALNADQGVYYKNLARRRPKDERFYFGWLDHRVVI